MNGPLSFLTQAPDPRLAQQEQLDALARLVPVAFPAIAYSIANASSTDDIFAKRAAVLTGAKALALVSGVYLGPNATIDGIPFLTYMTERYRSAVADMHDRDAVLADLLQITPLSMERYLRRGPE